MKNTHTKKNPSRVKTNNFKGLTVMRLRQEALLVMGLAEVRVSQVRQVSDVHVRQRVGQPPGVPAAPALSGRGGRGGGAQVGGAQLGGAAHPVLHPRHVVARPRLLLGARRRVGAQG